MRRPLGRFVLRIQQYERLQKVMPAHPAPTLGTARRWVRSAARPLLARPYDRLALASVSWVANAQALQSLHFGCLSYLLLCPALNVRYLATSLGQVNSALTRMREFVSRF